VLAFDPANLLVGLLASGIGFVLFSYGRKEVRPPLLIGGLLLMIYPYFTATLTSLVVGGLLIGAATWTAVWWGW
jgi:hypothetical protein